MSAGMLQDSQNARAGLYRRLGDTNRKHGEMEIAREYYAKAQTILTTHEDHLAKIEVMRCLTGTAWTYFLQGQSDQSTTGMHKEP